MSQRRISALPLVAAAILVGSLASACWAAPIQCSDGRGVYQAVSSPSHELTLAGDKGTLTLAKGRTRLAYPLTVTFSNGLARMYVTIAGKGAPSSVVMSLNPDFSSYRGEGAAPYLVTPDLSVGFYYWEPFRSRSDFGDLLPGDAWHLVRCSAAGK